MKIILALILLCVSCGEDVCHKFYYQSQFNYKNNFNQTTSAGIDIDTSNQNVSLELIDRLVKETEDCLNKNIGQGNKIPEDIIRDGQCMSEEMNCSLDKSCFKIKIPNDWMLSCDGTQQVLPAKAPSELCKAKGQSPTEECPCRWRAGIQDNNIIVSTPSLYLFKDPLIRVITGCNNPWGHPKLSECAMPTVEPL